MTFHRTALATSIALSTAALIACGGGGGGGDDSTRSSRDGAGAASGAAPGAPRTGNAIALTATGRLVSFDRETPGTQISSVSVTGLADGESLVGIDVRPADGRLYGLGSGGTVYQLDAATGIATAKSSLRAAAGDDNPFAGLSGTRFGFDFNPAADRLRVVSDTGQNLRINVDTGDTITDGAINPAGSTITASAYTNSFAGTTRTQLYAIDAQTGQLFDQDPPNAGSLKDPVPLGVTADGTAGFDVDGRTNTGYAALRVGRETALYTINLDATTNAATRIGAIAGGEELRGLALAAVAAPTALALTADNRLLSFNPRTPNSLTSSVTVSGLAAGESLVGIDTRPRDGLLWALSNQARLFTVDTASGAATLRAALAADPADTTAPYTGLQGTVTSVDFNPVADRLRVITSTGQNLRIVVETAGSGATAVTAGITTTDGAINRATQPAAVAASAYTNSFAGTTMTALHNLESNTDQLTLQSPPNNGTLADIGALGLDITGPSAFDIGGGDNGLALAALRPGGTGPFLLYTISLTTGAATLYNNPTAAPSASQIGGASGPANLIDLALRF